MTRFRASMQDPRRLAISAISAASLNTPFLLSTGVNSNVIPSLSPSVWQTVSTLGLPAGRKVSYRGWVHVEIISNDNVSRLAGEVFSLRLLYSDGQTGSTQSVTFAAGGPYQWFFSRLLNSDINMGIDITSVSVQILTGLTTSVVPLTIRSYLQFLPVPFKQLS